VVLIPAHDEEDGIRAALEALAICEYPSHSRRTVVIADNCTDRTAERARDGGAEVWERLDSSRRGKGEALIWAFDRLKAEASAFDAVVLLDADCIASTNLLGAIDQRLRSGTSALQVNYVVGNPESSVASALRFGAFALMNTVRSLGKQRLGLSCGLAGTGMAFAADLLDREPWTATGLTEDAEYHLRLVLAGERVEFLEDASVSSPMPTSLRGSSDQQARWEQGKLHLIGRWSPRLLRSGLARRDIVQIHAGLECLVPPQSLIAAGSILSLLAGSLLRSKPLVALSAATLGAQLVFVLAGLRLVRAPAQVYRALLAAPALIAAKVILYARLLGGRGPTAWTRTEREAPR
jgi:1,2-diacylglycerol 3-beta-glucosyltransferase